MNATANVDDIVSIWRRTHPTSSDGMGVIRDVLSNEAHEARLSDEPSWPSLDDIRKWFLPCQIVNQPNAFNQEGAKAARRKAEHFLAGGAARDR